MTEEEIESIVKKLTWHGFERILDEPAEGIGDDLILEEPALEAEDPTEEMADDATEAGVEESEDVLDEAVVDDGKISATEDDGTAKETSAESIEEPEAPVLPEGNFESAEATEEVKDEQSEETPLPEATEPKKIVIELPGSYLDEAELGRVRSIVASKATVLKKALETDDLSIERKEDEAFGKRKTKAEKALPNLCKHCGRPLDNTAGQRKSFCSDKCRIEWWKADRRKK